MVHFSIFLDDVAYKQGLTFCLDYKNKKKPRYGLFYYYLTEINSIQTRAPCALKQMHAPSQFYKHFLIHSYPRRILKTGLFFLLGLTQNAIFKQNGPKMS